MSLWSYNRFEARKKYNNRFSKKYKEFMLSFDMWWDDYVRWPYRYITKAFWERLGRALTFFKLGWNNFDWDSYYLHDLMLFKLKRLQHNFIHHGHHSEDCPNYKPKMKSLALAIKLLERHNTDFHEYYDKSTDRHDKKWGKLETWNEPCDIDDDGYVRTYRYHSKRENVNTPEEKEQERQEFLEAMRQDEARKQRDIDLVHKIIAKYHRYWWD